MFPSFQYDSPSPSETSAGPSHWSAASTTLAYTTVVPSGTTSPDCSPPAHPKVTSRPSTAGASSRATPSTRKTNTHDLPLVRQSLQEAYRLKLSASSRTLGDQTKPSSIDHTSTIGKHTVLDGKLIPYIHLWLR